MPPHTSQQARTEPESLSTQENNHDLARVITSEAWDLNETAQAMVGWTVFNRMKKHNLTRVSEIWANRQFAHGHFETGTSLRLAEGILGGTAMDISQGATHFYTPNIMPKMGEPHSGKDIGGGLESVPGVHKNGKPVQSYRPIWTRRFSAIRVPSVQERDFKFYREP